MAKISLNRNFNINRVVSKLIYTVLALYVGGTIMVTFGAVMNCTNSPFYQGLSLIGWTVSSSLTVVNSTVPTTCNTANSNLVAGTYSGVITATSGSGVLAVLGIIAIAGVVLEFIKF